MKQYLLFTLSLFFLFYQPGFAQDTWYVAPPNAEGTGGDNTNSGMSPENAWATIKFAVENAAVNSGDIIEIASGTYDELPFTIGKSLTLRGTGTGIVSVGPTPGTRTSVFAIEAENVLNVLIENLSINGSGIATNGLAINSGGTVTIQNSFVSGADVGILVGSAVTGVVLNNNNLEGNTTYALQNNSTDVIDASFNWWGSAERDGLDGVLSQLSGPVDYSPWLNSATDTDENAVGFQGDFSSVSVDGSSPGTGDNDLQDVVDLLNANDTIRLIDTENAYPELLISKPFVLIPQGQPEITALEVNASDVSTDTLFVMGDLLVSEGLLVVNGNIKTEEGGQVTLGDNIQETDEEDGRLIGDFITTPRSVASQASFSILGVNILGGTQANALAGLVVRRLSGDQGVIEENGGQSIKSNWSINANQAPSGRGLTFSWHSSLDNRLSEPINEGSVIVWRRPDSATEWEPITDGVGVANVNDFRVVSVPADAVPGFSTWTISDENEPLPVTLTDFTARLEETSVRLEWVTASESNAHFFGIERSSDGFIFEEIARNQAAGTSNSLRTYRYVDEGIANRLSGTLYYRLRMVDFDDSFEYSDIVAVSLTDNNDLRVYADAQTGTLRLFTRQLPADEYLVQVSDMLGHVILESSVTATEENAVFQFPWHSPARTVYIVRCFGTRALFTQKFRVE